MTIPLRLKNALRPLVRRIANGVVRQSDLPALVLQLQHDLLKTHLDLARPPGPETEEDRALTSLVPLLLPFACTPPLTRVGGPADGGYVMADDFAGTVAVSLGVGWDDTWEGDLLGRGAISCVQVDASIRRPPRRLPRTGFHRWYIGDVDDRERMGLSLQGLLGLVPGEADLTVKMDIEGSEWRALDRAPDAFFTRTRQLSIELHEWTRLGERDWVQAATRVLERLRATHVPIHLRANNAVPMHRTGTFALPSALEVTYLRRDRAGTLTEVTSLRTPHDRPNDLRIPEVSLDGWLRRVP